MFIFSRSMRRNDYVGASGQKSDPAIHSGDLDFLNTGVFTLQGDVYSI